MLPRCYEYVGCQSCFFPLAGVINRISCPCSIDLCEQSKCSTFRHSEGIFCAQMVISSIGQMSDCIFQVGLYELIDGLWCSLFEGLGIVVRSISACGKSDMSEPSQQFKIVEGTQTTGFCHIDCSQSSVCFIVTIRFFR